MILPVSWRATEDDHFMSTNTLLCIGLGLTLFFPSYTVCSSGQPYPVQSSGNRDCVPGSRLAQACLVYHSGLNCLSYGRVFICITNGGWLIMWFLVRIRSPLELAQSLPTIYSLHMSQIFQFWFQIFYPTVSRSTLYACQTTCQFMVWEI